MKDYDNQILKQAFAFPNEDEMAVAMILVDNGTKSILFLTPNLTPGAKTPDILIDKKLKWEIKTPSKSSERTLQHAFRSALKQSSNVIFYTNKIKTPEKSTIRTLERLFSELKTAKRLKIITKSDEIIDFVK
jgi:membrane peptidoglycan carboxypeptidase